MRRFHVNVPVDDLAQSIRFHTALLATEPAVRRDDYAKKPGACCVPLKASTDEPCCTPTSTSTTACCA
jgi:catechol 2,3-dioxygenase-like lactoylglutathione lyase family enzyme